MNGKNRKILWQIVPMIVILFTAAILVTWQITYNYTKNEMNEKYSQMLSQVTAENDISRVMYNVDSILRSKYIGEIDSRKLADSTIQGYVYGLGDKYAYYMNAEEFAEYMLETSDGVKTGIGVTVVYDNSAGGMYVTSVYKDTPASKGGIVPGEVITRVNGKLVTEIGYNLAVEEIGNGEEGSSVELTVMSESGTERAVTLKREIIKLETVTWRMLNSDTGLITISEFTLNTPEEFKNAIQDLTVNGAQRFIFDVRNNPGGNLEGISETLDFLLPEGNIIIINEKSGTQRTIVSDTAEFSAPMAVLVNGNTASAAELFTAALRDYDKAEIVGETTYGKGSMQEIVNLPGGGAASVSVSTYLPPCGVSYDGEGIDPDYPVSLPEETLQNYHKMTDEQDLQLQKAIEIVAAMEVNTYQ
ncbi:MAG: carboxyl-terminal protease [Clostridiales bacterium]|nr:MAG: carboxyl-terminal protease [Clostridiales bacterium]